MFPNKCVFRVTKDDEEETEGADTERVRRSDGLSMLDDDDDLDADETTRPLECPPGCALSRSAPPLCLIHHW